MKSLFNCFRHLWNHRMRFYLFTLRIRESGFAGELWAGISNTACPHTKCVWVVTFLNYETLPNHKYNIFWKNPRKIIVLLKMDQKTNLKWIPSQICHIFGLLNMWENPKKKSKFKVAIFACKWLAYKWHEKIRPDSEPLSAQWTKIRKKTSKFKIRSCNIHWSQFDLRGSYTKSLRRS